MKYIKEIVVMMVALVTFSMCVLGMPSDPVREGTTDSNAWNGSGALSMDNFSVEGGNYSNYNFTQKVRTDNWAILYGTASMSWVFEDHLLNTAYTFTSSASPSGYIFFANSTSVNWGTLDGSQTAFYLTREDDRLGLTSTAKDSVNYTFTESTSGHPLVNYTGIAAAGGISADTSYGLQTLDGSSNPRWFTAQLQDAAGVKTYCAFVNQSSNTAFNGEAADYQVMLPTPNDGKRDYFVYLALE